MSLTQAESELISRVDADADNWLGWLRQLVAIPTVNPHSGDADAVGEAVGQAWMAARLQALGARVRRIPVPPDIYARAGVRGSPDRTWAGRDNVIGEWCFGEGGPTVILNSHMDTVGVADMEIAPFDPVLRDGRVFGRGSSDSKGNLTMALAAVHALLDSGSGWRGRLVLESVVDEECGGAGAGTLACCQAGVTGDVAIVLDGARGTIACGCNGGTTARLKVYGQAGHSSAGVAVSAIDKGIAVKQAVDTFGADYARRFPTCQGSVRVFRAGHYPSVVPGTAELWINLTYDVTEAREQERLTGRWDGALFQQRLDAHLRALGNSDAWFRARPVEVEWRYDLPPYAMDPDGALPRLALQACQDTGDLPAVVRPMPAWFDAARIARQLRIPVIGMGHGTPGMAHSGGESVEIAGLAAGARALAVALARLLSPDAQTLDWRRLESTAVDSSRCTHSRRDTRP